MAMVDEVDSMVKALNSHRQTLERITSLSLFSRKAAHLSLSLSVYLQAVSKTLQTKRQDIIIAVINVINNHKIENVKQDRVICATVRENAHSVITT